MFRSGNVIYLTNMRSEGNKMGGYYQSGSSAETSLSGVAYTNQLPTIDEFNKLIGDKKTFTAIGQAKLWSSGSDMSKSDIQKNFRINNIINQNGLIMINGDLEDESSYKSFRVVSFDKDSFHIFFQDKSTSYNLTIKI